MCNAPYISDGIWYSSNPDMVFLGEPESEYGWGIWAKGLARSINYFFDEIGIKADAVYSCSDTLDNLCFRYIRNNIPVIVWCTMDMAEPYRNISPRIENSADSFTWISPNHCMVLVGYDATGYYFNDPYDRRMPKIRENGVSDSFQCQQFSVRCYCHR